MTIVAARQTYNLRCKAAFSRKLSGMACRKRIEDGPVPIARLPKFATPEKDGPLEDPEWQPPRRAKKGMERAEEKEENENVGGTGVVGESEEVGWHGEDESTKR